MKNIAFGQYYPADSVIHRIDPRAKLIIATICIVCTFICKNALCFLVLTAAAVALTFVSKIPIKVLLKTMKPLLFILAFTSLINIFATKGDPEHLITPDVWRIKIYTDGLWNALFMILRLMILLATTGIFLTFTTTPIALTDAMEQLFSPLKKLKIPVHDIAMMTTIALRFIPTLAEETEKIMNAQKARGAGFSEGGLIKRAKALIPVFIPLLSSAFKRADELANAMDCRCYNGGEGRTRLKVLHFCASDWGFMILTLGFGVGIFFLNRLGIGYTM